MNNSPILISYYTGDSYYEDCSCNIKKSCESLGIPIIIEKIKDLGAYWKNTLMKPSFILKKMEELKTDIIWIDIDTKIYDYPQCFKSWRSDILAASHTGDLQGIKASPLGIKNNKKAIQFISEWKDFCNERIKNNDVDLDHDILKYEILPKSVNDLSIEIMKDFFNPNDFTNGRIIDNGISRVPNKYNDIRNVLEKNKRRENLFYNLSLNDFKNHENI